MQERDYIPSLGLTPSKFWEEVKENAELHDMDEILAYLDKMLTHAKFKDTQISKASFKECGRKLELFAGVEEWFDRITDYGKYKKVVVEHYIISSGLREMIEGTTVFKKCKYVFASGFKYTADGVAVWPALAVNYTNKAQYLFRINKGILNSWDNRKINKYMRDVDRRIPFENIVYIGDGETDIPAMKMTTYQRGTAIAVYPPGKAGAKKKAQELLAQDRASAAAPADYREGSALDTAIKAVIDRVAASTAFSKAVLER